MLNWKLQKEKFQLHSMHFSIFTSFEKQRMVK